LSCIAAFADPLTPEALIVGAARCWRDASDRRLPVMPALYARLEIRGAALLAPAIAALMAMYEAWSGQCFNAGEQAASALTEDERTLLVCLDAAAPPALLNPLRPGLEEPLRIALRSTRILARGVFGRDLSGPSVAPVPSRGAPRFLHGATAYRPASRDL